MCAAGVRVERYIEWYFISGAYIKFTMSDSTILYLLELLLKTPVLLSPEV